ncbi:MAG: family 10 glycosylhydrolase [Verrucomicrobia bacterium]|nr:family 10 glycosylhydrolase [Verrucomicrobiota bacterium]
MASSLFTCLRPLRVAVAFVLGATFVQAAGFTTRTAPAVTAEKAANMDVRYFTELLGRSSKGSVESQFTPLANTEVTTVVCCPMGWRFYSFPSEVDLTWKEPDKFPRHDALFPNFRKVVGYLQAGGDPLKDAVDATRRLGKRFIVSFRMNDSHYVKVEDFPSHNNFWRAHPELRLGSDITGSPLSENSPVFDYLRPEVRDFYFSVLEEICTKYDVDGVELDFQRAPRFFHDRNIGAGRAVMTAHVGRIRGMLDRIGAQRGRPMELSVRVLHTIQANWDIGADVMAWDAAGWLDGIIVSSGYIHTADTGIEEFVAARKKAKVHGELNFVHFQAAGTGHNPNDRRYLTPETYRAATLSYLERGADGVSYFNTYCVPQPALNRLTASLLGKYRDLGVLQRADKNYTTYANPATMAGRIFPAKDKKTFQVFIADARPADATRAVLRIETKAESQGLKMEASVNGSDLEEVFPAEPELFPPLAVNNASARRERLRFFAVPVAVLKFGVNQVAVRNLETNRKSCDFISSELALYLGN